MLAEMRKFSSHINIIISILAQCASTTHDYQNITASKQYKCNHVTNTKTNSSNTSNIFRKANTNEQLCGKFEKFINKSSSDGKYSCVASNRINKVSVVQAAVLYKQVEILWLPHRNVMKWSWNTLTMYNCAFLDIPNILGHFTFNGIKDWS